jgi:hypothetical protein
MHSRTIFRRASCSGFALKILCSLACHRTPFHLRSEGCNTLSTSLCSRQGLLHRLLVPAVSPHWPHHEEPVAVGICHDPSTSTKILPSLTSYFARSWASASESTLIAACGCRALIARMASALSGMATSAHSCSGDAPPGFGITVTIFHPFAMCLVCHELGLPQSLRRIVLNWRFG